MLRAREPILREICRKQAISRGFRSVELFRVSRIAQEFPQACRLRACRTKCVEHLFRGKIQQPPDSCRRCESARCARSMKNLIVSAAKKFTDTNTNFVASHRRSQ